MAEKELCSVLLCSISMSDSDIIFYRKSSISISVFNLGLFGDVREHWSQPRLACVPWLCNMGREDVQQVQSHVPCGTAEASSWVLGRFFSFKNKI